MDPNATLAELRTMLGKYMKSSDSAADCEDLDDEAARRSADLFDALDNWLRAGGCLPEDWAR